MPANPIMSRAAPAATARTPGTWTNGTTIPAPRTPPTRMTATIPVSTRAAATSSISETAGVLPPPGNMGEEVAPRPFDSRVQVVRDLQRERVVDRQLLQRLEAS